MSQILVFSCEGDPALATARLVADWTVARLQQEGHHITAQMGPHATPAALEQSLPPHDGLAAFSHGREDALLDGQGNILLAQPNIHLLSNKWAWLFACRTAGALGALALHAGARCFAGFEVALIVDWDESDVPIDIQPIFRQLMTEVPVQLALGHVDQTYIQKCLVPMVDQILDYCSDHEQGGGLEITAQQMLRRLKVMTSTNGTDL